LVNEIDCDLINGLCDAINEKSDGSQIALRFLAHKIQSPQERESLQALIVWIYKLIDNYLVFIKNI
jgi:ADP-ribosylation factor-binding protein GGA